MSDPLGVFLFNYLSDVLGSDEVHPNTLPERTPMPAITWFLVPSGASRLATHGDAHTGAGSPLGQFHMSRVQISCWAKTPEEATRIGEDVAFRMHGLRGDVFGLAIGSSLIDTEFDDFEEKEALHRRILNAMMQYTIPVGS